MGHIRNVLFWALIAVVGNAILKFYISTDPNKRQLNHAPGRCRLVTGINDGSEDMDLHPDGIALISSGARIGGIPEFEGVKGKIFMYKFAKKVGEKSAKDPPAIELKIVSKTLNVETFNPHGISIFLDKGTTHLYVINHVPEGDTIERFTFDEGKQTLTHTKSIKHPAIRAANDLVVIGLDKFYVTNSHYFKNPYLFKLELTLQPALGSIVYYDGKVARVIDQWLPCPNGINVDKARKHLYVSLTWEKTVRIYEIQNDGNISHQRDIKLHTSPDNIWVDQESGDVWIGAHPVMHLVLKHFAHPKTEKIPSQVIRIRLAKRIGETDYIGEPYGNDGSVLSGSSVAVQYKNQMLVGTVFNQMLLCDILDPKLI